MIKKIISRLKKGDRFETPGEIEIAVKDLIDDLAHRLEQQYTAPESKRGLWIFKSKIDRGLYARAIVGILNTEIDRVREEKIDYDKIDFSCACRCRVHHRVACAICLDYVMCPLHADPNETVVVKIRS